MRFFHIDNSVCCSCGRCRTDCPTGAVTPGDGDRLTIDYDRCNLCGNCLRTCDDGAVRMLSLSEVVADMDAARRHRARARQLEAELDVYREKFRETEDMFLRTVRSLPFPVLLADRAETIIAASGHFRNLMKKCGWEEIGYTNAAGSFCGHGNNSAKASAQCLNSGASQPDLVLRGLKAPAVLPAELLDILRTSLRRTEEGIFTAGAAAKPYIVDARFPTANHVLVSLRPVDDDGAVNENVADMIRSAIESKMSLVQKIGSLLGEESSRELGELNTALDIIESRKNNG